MIDFRGRVAIVTGAGKGLGRSHAEALARRGAAVLVNNRSHAGDPSSADAVVGRIHESGGIAIANYESVEEPDAGERIVAAALAAFGRIDVIVANAGWSEPTAFHRESDAHVRRMIEVNTLSAVELVRAALPHLRAQKYGRIVVSTSSAALFGDAGFVSYATAKAALIGFVAALSQESVRAGITVNAVLPFAHTPMTDGLFAGDTFPEGTAEAMVPETVSNLLLWLLSEQCQESGQTWLAGGKAIRKAIMQVTPGIVVDTDDLSPELLADHAAAIADPAGAREYGSGAELLTAMAEASLGAP
ncbi:SDR family NAD(P)-dependent oxidoreductase [Mycobacterium paraffinicum]|uniref:SDR family NAD(P)-dependent oxidoreductase n=1 Tax=Mycobacterium paraffinicum TaxID=53378 RepID=UPI00142DBA1A|nr:SDR family NAD(P)-dependent oxidoreductase [Mycobacterium paraffinicum]